MIRIYKEARELGPMLLGSLVLIEAPYALWGRAAEDFGMVTLGLGCLLLAASVFGQEFQHRTITLLLAQPILRRRMWWEKMLVLGVAISVATALLRWNLHRYWAGYYSSAPLLLIPLCAFCGGPWLTLEARSGTVGAVSAAGLPGALLACEALVLGTWWHCRDPFIYRVMIGSLLVYSGVAAWCGYAGFKKYQVIGGAVGRELALPRRMEAWLEQKLLGVSGQSTGPVASLLKKELRLQQIVFILSGLFVLGSITGTVLYYHSREWAVVVFALCYSLHLLLVPSLLGSISTAEERGWGLATWHLSLPPSARIQWNVKSAVVLGLSLLLGLALPVVMFGLAALLTEGRTSLTAADAQDFLHALPYIVLGELIATSLSAYAGTLCRNTLWAILLAWGLLLAFACGLWWVHMHLAWLRKFLFGEDPGASEIFVQLASCTLVLCMLALLGVLQSFAYSNFKRGGASPSRFLLQVGVLYVVVWLFLFSLLVHLNSITPI